MSSEYLSSAFCAALRALFFSWPIASAFYETEMSKIIFLKDLKEGLSIHIRNSSSYSERACTYQAELIHPINHFCVCVHESIIRFLSVLVFFIRRVLSVSVEDLPLGTSCNTPMA